MTTTVNKTDFIEKFATNLQTSKKEAGDIVDSFFDTITEVLCSNGDEVKLVFTGFLSFEAQTKEARNGRNPSTGEKIVIPPKKVVKMKAGAGLKKKVEESAKSFCCKGKKC